MPPFGNLYGLDVYVAPSLAEDKEIAFQRRVAHGTGARPQRFCAIGQAAGDLVYNLKPS